MSNEMSYYLFDQRLLARREGNNAPELLGGAEAGVWAVYPDVERFDYNCEKISKSKYLKLLGEQLPEIISKKVAKEVAGQAEAGFSKVLGAVSKKDTFVAHKLTPEESHAAALAVQTMSPVEKYNYMAALGILDPAVRDKLVQSVP